MGTTTTVEEAVHAALARVDDPEIHKPITELGMVKSVAVAPDGIAPRRASTSPWRAARCARRSPSGSPRPSAQVPGVSAVAASSST